MSTITKANGYAVNGKLFTSIEDATRAALCELFAVMDKPLVDIVLERREELLAILTTGPRTRPRARKVAATTNPRRAARRAAPMDNGATLPLPIT